MKQFAASPQALSQNLKNSTKGRWFRVYENCAEVQQDGPIHTAMKLIKSGWSSKNLQPALLE